MQEKTCQQIVVTEIPYEVIKGQLVKKMDEIRVSKEIDGILDVRDESDRNGLRIVVDIKKESDANMILNYFYKNTDLQVFYSYNNVAIIDKTPVQVGLLGLLDAFIDFRNQTHAAIEGLLRIDTRDYPEVAVREALLNLLVHRDYSFSASALISMYEDRIEFVSIGGLVPGIELEDVMAGISICRNQDLANVFYRLQLIEAYGTGISKMMMAYRDMPQKPVIETTKNTFKIILPNVNVRQQYTRTKPPVYRVEDQPMQYSYNAAETKGLSDEEEIIMEYIRKHDRLTKHQAAELLEVSASTATRLLKRMVERQMIKRNGKARNTYYTEIK